ncbi:uncharacterized protein LOC133900915 [Phragmites australis]|uniref:uncharacterized protein LOC133900915 n=1 Tax=Phragmites australis TaxID=29695 RepID=UPI002D799218|nr:uncharacterized protein LOC133900915 [Phragmites australis]
MPQSNGVEHRVRVPAHGGAGQGKAGATPEKQLNGFARSVALIERVGNALGTLAFTWATVVLLGGYPTVLRPDYDFWFATAIVFLESARMFSRNNRMDYRLFFHTRGAVRPLGWNGLIVVVCLSNVRMYLIMFRHKYLYESLVHEKGVRIFAIYRALLIGLFVLTAAIGQFLSPGALKLLSKPLRRAASLCSPLVAVLLLVPSIPYSKKGHMVPMYTLRNTMAKWIAFLVLFLAALLLTVSRLRSPRIIKLVDCVMGSKKVFWRRLILSLCMLAALLMLVFMIDPFDQIVMITYQLYALLVVSFGNLQIPAALVRVVLALVRLGPHDYCGNKQIDNCNEGEKTNLAPSLDIFYKMVLGQGILYLVACALEIFSFILRRSLVHYGGFKGQWGVESVNLYYAYALEKFTQGDVLTPKMISLSSFAIDSLNADSSKNQLLGIRIMHSLLQREPTRTQLPSKLNASIKTMTSLIRMLDLTNPEDTTTRIFAAKVVADLAKSLRAVTIPGTIQVVSALLDYGNQQKRGNPLLDTDDEQEAVHDPILNAADNLEERQYAVTDTSIMLETKERSTLQVGTAEQKSCILRRWQRISEFWSIPQEEELTKQDLLPALGMSILDNLAGCDQDNCAEISRASGLIPKIVGFTSYCRSDTMNTDAQQKVLVESSLKLLHRLTSIDGEIGITLRHKVSKHPFLLRNLSEILGDSTSSQELKKLVAGILRNLAIDENARQAIGRIQVIITRLMRAFLTPDGPFSTDADRLLRKVAGQALAMLAIDSVNNCLAMLRETGYVLVKELTSMVHVEEYVPARSTRA